MSLAAGILGASTLSYIGLGAQAPTPEWGALLAVGRSYIRDHSYLVTAPGVIIMLTVFSLYSLGDGLRDALDPRLRGR
jgi:peptide/nickel transport system permease protein